MGGRRNALHRDACPRPVAEWVPAPTRSAGGKSAKGLSESDDYGIFEVEDEPPDAALRLTRRINDTIKALSKTRLSGSGVMKVTG